MTQGNIDPQVLIELARMEMPFGKYKGRILCDLPEPYLVWFARKGFPQGRLGMLLEALYVIKVNGLEYLLKPIKKKPEEKPRKPGRIHRFDSEG